MRPHFPNLVGLSGALSIIGKYKGVPPPEPKKPKKPNMEFQASCACGDSSTACLDAGLDCNTKKPTRKLEIDFTSSPPYNTK